MSGQMALLKYVLFPFKIFLAHEVFVLTVMNLVYKSARVRKAIRRLFSLGTTLSEERIPEHVAQALAKKDLTPVAESARAHSYFLS